MTINKGETMRLQLTEAGERYRENWLRAINGKFKSPVRYAQFTPEGNPVEPLDDQGRARYNVVGTEARTVAKWARMNGNVAVNLITLEVVEG